MKQHVKCPKCDEQEIIRVPGEIGAFGSGNNIKLGGIPVRRIAVTRYVCASCGFSEDWIDDPKDIEQMKKKFGVYAP
jgi:predicted nucleic-acid-binding Zn-ribbon protein